MGPIKLGPIKQQPMQTDRLTDLSYLNEASAGNRKFIKNMIETFIAQTPELVKILKETSEKQDWIEFRKIMHKFKPTLAMMGINSLKDDVTFLETNVKQGLHLEKVPEKVLNIESICQKALIELKKELSAFSE